MPLSHWLKYHFYYRKTVEKWNAVLWGCMAALPAADVVVGNNKIVSFLRLNFATQEGCR